MADDRPQGREYKFVSGRGDPSHADLLNQAAEQGYAAKLIVLDPNGDSKNEEIVVLMEKTT
jgi:hypothetical protein